MDQVLYFGYGANRDPRMIEAITGNKNLVGKPAVLKDWELCVQRFDQIPSEIIPSAPAPFSPQDAVRRSWNEDFSTYVIRPAKGKEVHGTMWELTPQDRELLRDWELIDFGWYKGVSVEIETEDGKLQVQTEVLGDGQGIDRVVDGQDYPTFLNELTDFQRNAEQSRKEYFARLVEGQPKSTETK